MHNIHLVDKIFATVFYKIDVYHMSATCELFYLFINENTPDKESLYAK